MSLVPKGLRKHPWEDPDAYYELSTELLAAVDLEGYFHWVNPVWERTLGHGVDDLVGRPIVEFVHHDDLARTSAELQRLTGGGSEPVTFESRFRAADGGYVWLEWQARPSPDEGLIRAVARDLTERRRFVGSSAAPRSTARKRTAPKATSSLG
jgi:PAS domain S-box-containing protein